MEAVVIASIIGAGATICAAILGQLGAFEKLFRSGRYPKLPTEWISIWIDGKDQKRKERREKLFITKQSGSKIRGHILYDTAPDKRWEFEGNFTGRFLQLFYYPSAKADDQYFQDYGCYFFQLEGTDFIGYSIGYDYDSRVIDVSEHKLIEKK